MKAWIQIGPVRTLYIDMPADNPTSAMLTIKENGVTKMRLKQDGTIETVGAMVFSTVDTMKAS